MRGEPGPRPGGLRGALDRGFGKPVQSVGIDPDSVPIQKITVQLVAMTADAEPEATP